MPQQQSVDGELLQLAYNMGARAAQMGLDYGDNPFDPAPHGCIYYSEWIRGFYDEIVVQNRTKESLQKKTLKEWMTDWGYF